MRVDYFPNIRQLIEWTQHPSLQEMFFLPSFRATQSYFNLDLKDTEVKEK